MAFDPSLLEVLVCPVSKAQLRYLPASPGHPESLLCPQSRLRYRIDDGVPVLLREEATELGEAAVEALLAVADAT